MSTPLVDRIPFAKIVVILAIAFGISLGLCGLNMVLSIGGTQRFVALGPLLGIAGVLELVVMLLSAVGLVLTCIVWVIAAAIGGFRKKDQEPQKLFEDKDET
jgi:hypothetical protein